MEKRTIKNILSILVILIFYNINLRAQVPASKPVLQGEIWVSLGTAPTSPFLNQRYLKTDGEYYYWNGSAWIKELRDIGSIPDGGIINQFIADDAITTGKILNGTIQGADLQDATITNEKINATAAISLSKLAATTPSSPIISNVSGILQATTASNFIYDILDLDSAFPELDEDNEFTSFNYFQNYIYQGGNGSESQKRWLFGKNPGVAEGDFLFGQQSSLSTDYSGGYNTLYKLNKSGIPTDGSDLINKSYADANYSGGGTGIDWSDPVDSDIIPDTDQAYDLGTGLKQFGSIYATSFEGGAFNGSGFEGYHMNLSQYLTLGNNVMSDFTGFPANGSIIFWDDTAERIKYGLGGTSTVKTLALEDDLLDDSLLVHKAGTETITGTKTFTASSTTFNGNLSTYHILPDGNATRTLGQSTSQWLNIFTRRVNYSSSVAANIDWLVMSDISDGSLGFYYESSGGSGSWSDYYSLNPSGDPVNAQDLADKEYVDSVVGGGGIPDGDKGDITVSSGTWTIDNAAVTSAKIADGTIVNADISSGAAIGLSKLTNITPNSILGNLTGSSTYPNVYTYEQVRTALNVENGATADLTGAEIKALYEAEDDTNAFTDTNATTLSTALQPGDIRDNLVSPSSVTVASTNAVATALEGSELLGTETATTSRTAVLTDADGIVEVTNATNMVYTIPENASVAFPTGTLLMLRRNGTGNITIAYSGAATGDVASTYKYGETLSLRKIDTDEWVILNPPRPDYESYMIACSDLTTDITTGTTKAYIDMPHTWTFTNCSVSLLDAGISTGITVDINVNGTSALSTKLTTDATETNSLTASTPYVISDSTWSNGDRITFDFDAVPTGATGVIVTITGYR